MTPYRTVVIGCGANTPTKGGASAIAYAHGWAYQKDERINMVAACDLVEQNALDYIAEFDISRCYDDYRVMLQKEQVDIVSICTYAKTHLQMLEDALDAGVKGVWLEKPMSYDIDESREIARITEAANAKVIVHHRFRLGKVFAWAREAIEGGRIGTVRNVQVTNCVDWWNDLYDVGCHTIDLVRMMLGDPMPTEVFATLETQGNSQYKDGRIRENRCLATVMFDNRVRLVMDCADTRLADEPLIRINGTEGFIELFLELPGETEHTIRACLDGEPTIVTPRLDEHFFGSSENLNLHTEYALADLLTAMESGHDPVLSPAHILPTMEIIDAIVLSSEEQSHRCFEKGC